MKYSENKGCLPKKDDWAVECCGKVEGSMSVSLTGSSLAEVAHHAQAVLCSFIAICCTNSYVFKKFVN